ncbi:MAG: T9SS type A sorting domain-containing protein [Candidatus Hatepunaea meridiana]|nr:T9SS type A sorting domain-containing protein [Candidatus Hatepunaea meridiana]
MKLSIRRYTRHVGLILLLLLAILFTGLTYAQQHTGIEQISYIRTMWDFAYDVAAEDSLAYIATGFSGLQILSFASPDNPVFVGYWQDLSLSLTRITIANGRVYAAAGQQGFVIIDVSNPRQPLRDRHYRNYDVVHDVQVRNNYAFLAAFRDGLIILDVSDPAEPEEVTGIDTPGELRGLFIENDIAYLADGRTGLQIVDVHDPTTPELLATCDVGGTVDRVFAQENLAYLISGAIGLVIVDVSDPEEPEVLSRFAQDQIPYDVEVQDTLACITSGCYMRILNVSDPRNPTHLSFFRASPGDRIRGIALVDNIICLSAGFNGFYTADLTDIRGNIRPVGEFNSKGELSNLVVVDSLVYASKIEDGMIIMNYSNLEEIQILNFFGGTVRDLDIVGNYAYYAGEITFNVADLSLPAAPERIINLRGNGSNRDVFVDGTRAYTCAINGGLRVYDITDPEETTELGRSGVSGYHNDFVAAEDIGYLADSYRGLQVMNVEDPTNLIHVNYININPHSGGFGLWLTDTLLYYAIGEAGLLVYDISTRDDPVEITRFDPEAPVRDVIVNGNHAYLACGEYGLMILNIADLNSMHVVGFYNTHGDAQGLFLDHNHELVYVADGIGIGIYDAAQALRIKTPGKKQLTPAVPSFTVFPNPANARFNFYFQSAPSNGGALKIYDIFGHLVHRAPYIRGDSFLQWDAGNIPSGTYIARVGGAKDGSSIRIILQK